MKSFLEVNFSALLCYAYILGFLLQRKDRNREATRHLLSLFALELYECLICNLEQWFAAQPTLSYVRVLLCAVGYTMRPVLIYSLISLLDAEKMKGRFKYIFALPAWVNAFVSFSAFWTDTAFGFTADNVFYRGPLGYFEYWVIAFYTLALLFFCIRLSAKKERQEALIVLSVAVTVGASMALETVVGLHSIGRTGIALSTVFYLIHAETREHRDELLSLQLKKETEVRHHSEEQALQVVRTLAHTIDAKDDYTNGHSTRVAEYAVILATALGWSEEDIRNLHYAALLHDIGKIVVPDTILNKPSRLTDVEYEIIKSHTTIGSDIIKSITTIPGVDDVVRHHHERYDGRGYPDRLKGEGIPLNARLVCICDAYDAMTSHRVYRRALDKDFVRSELVHGRGTQFDPQMLDVFLQLLDTGRLALSDKAEQQLQIPDPDELVKKYLESPEEQRRVAEGYDYLTGLPAHTEAVRAISEAMRASGRGCLYSIDVDRLKFINDTYGHAIGDRVLRTVADLLREFSADAVISRPGSDQFIYFQKDADREAAKARAEAILARYDALSADDRLLQQTGIALGLCLCAPAERYEDVYTRADKALYHCKHSNERYAFYEGGRMQAGENGRADLDALVRSLQPGGRQGGVMDLEYHEFARIYEFLTNMNARYRQDFHLLMITLDEAVPGTVLSDELEQAMRIMEETIRKTIRSVDVCTRYSGVQLLVILVGTAEENVQPIMERIFKGFYRAMGSNRVQPGYALARLDGRAEAAGPKPE